MISCQADHSVFHDASKIPLKITGRHYFEDSKVKFSNSAVSIRFHVKAKKITLVLESLSSPDEKQANWVQILINGELKEPIFLKKGKYNYDLTFNQPENEVKIIKCTENYVGEIIFHGISSQKDTEFLPITKETKKEILFIGNSITCGYGNMLSISAPPAGDPLTGFHAINENAYESYALKTARKRNLEAELCCFSGIGMFRNFDGDTNQTMPKIFNRVLLHKKNSPDWDFTKSNTSIIVINLGTNDYFLESENKPLNEKRFEECYRNFILKLHQLYPKAIFICATGSMMSDYWPENKQCLSRLKKNISTVISSFQESDILISSFDFTPQNPPFGEDYHPTKATHEKMAIELANYLENLGY